MIVLHYTGMQDGPSAIDRLCDPEAKVSAHYVVDEDGTRARAGARGQARLACRAGRTGASGTTSTTARSGSRSSIRGTTGAIARFPDEQVDAVVRLVARDQGPARDHPRQRRRPFRHRAGAQARSGRAVSVGSGSRKLRLALPRPTKNLMDPQWTEGGLPARARAVRLRRDRQDGGDHGVPAPVPARAGRRRDRRRVPDDPARAAVA